MRIGADTHCRWTKICISCATPKSKGQSKESYGARSLTEPRKFNAKILGVFPMPSKSHHILGESLLQGLAKAGHDVTMLSPFISKKLFPNYKDLVVSELTTLKNGLSKTMLDLHNSSLYAKITSSLQLIDLVENTLYNSTIVRKIMQDEIQYDVAIITWFGNDAVLAFAQQIANHSVIFSTVGSNPMVATLAKVPAPTSYVPNMMPPFPDEMSFLQRLGNTITSFVFTLMTTFINCHQRILIDKYFPNAPSVQDMYEHVSLILLNTHHSIESPRPYVPTMIQVGGLQLENSEELTGELKTFMDSAKEGVVYFSLGSNVQSSHMDDQKLQDILKCFSKLPYKVLWKLESSNTPNLPKNVKISKWLPQKDLLAHKNMKLFITHGGLLSTTEALYHGVPMVGIPLFGDQEGNVIEGVLKGYLVHLPYSDINEQSFTNAIEEVIKKSKGECSNAIQGVQRSANEAIGNRNLLGGICYKTQRSTSFEN
ncbi:hypothetical protein FQA39_LY11728 [Lamprigera yunnana]|nr:hypothetical protein FQA39_LY11728 [Lamprigera yunnana]